jgi:hypothetical protein
METKTIFGHKLFTATCNDASIYQSVELKNSIESVFKMPEIAKFMDPSQKGQALTSVGARFHLAKLPGMGPLMRWITQQVNEAGKELNLSGSQIVFPRGWANRMFKDCEGRCHTHPIQAHGVVIFYYEVPDDSAELVLIENGTNGSEYHDYPAEKKYHIPVTAGQLVIHHPSVPHAVSRHLSDQPRTCFIFEFAFVD